MKTSIFFFIIIILILSAAPADALGGGDKKTQEVQVTGRVRLVGSTLINSLVITNEDREWYINQKDEKKLRQLQQQIVTVTGKEYYLDLVFANGAPAGRQYFLKDIKIIVPK